MAICATALMAIASCAAPDVRNTSLLEMQKRKTYKIASWYGPGFDGLRTASGEVYDMNAMTCAHKSLPFGTRLRITNVDNGLSVEVVVNDRGPFVDGRDIDLSRAAADALGLIGPGTGFVKVKNIGRDMRYDRYLKEGSVPDTYEPVKDGPYTVQVAAFREFGSAEHIMKGLELSQKDVYMLQLKTDTGVLYRVRIGKFGSKKKAQNLAVDLMKQGYSTMITQYEEPDALSN